MIGNLAVDPILPEHDFGCFFEHPEQQDALDMLLEDAAWNHPDVTFVPIRDAVNAEGDRLYTEDWHHLNTDGQAFLATLLCRHSTFVNQVEGNSCAEPL